MKKQFCSEGGLDRVVAFIRDGDASKQSPSQLADAIKIVWTCTFNNDESLAILKQDAPLIRQVHALADRAQAQNDDQLLKTADGLIWRLEKEEEFKKQQELQQEQKRQEKRRKAVAAGKNPDDADDDDDEEENKFDLMISYSWADMDLAHRIFNHLTEKLGYRIWIDKEQMHGSTIEAMVSNARSKYFSQV